MKRIAIILSLILGLGISVKAQTMSSEMTKAIAICSNMSRAIGKTDVSLLRNSNKELKAADISNFGDLWIQKGKEINVDGHFIFDEEFVDSLIVNRKVIKFSSRYAKKRIHRGGGKAGRIKMTTKALKAGQSCTWKTMDRKDTEYAIVAEPDGLFTMTIRNQNGKVLYAETVKNKQGDIVRKAKIKLPDKATKVYIEVKNCGKKNASFALLSNKK